MVNLKFEDAEMAIGICAFVIGMVQLIMGDLNNNIEMMIWGLMCTMLWMKSSILALR